MEGLRVSRMEQAPSSPSLHNCNEDSRKAERAMIGGLQRAQEGMWMVQEVHHKRSHPTRDESPSVLPQLSWRCPSWLGGAEV